MHSWVFRQRDQLQRIYGFPESLLTDEGLELESEAAPQALEADPEAPEGPVQPQPSVRRIAMTPMPRRVR